MWISAGPLTSFPEGQITGLELSGRSLIVIHWGEAYFCFDDACSHQPVKLSEFGVLGQGGVLMCQAHGACFDTTKGGIPLCFPARDGLVARKTRVAGSSLEILLD